MKSRSSEDMAMNSGDLPPCWDKEHLPFCVRHLATEKSRKG